VEAFLAVSEVVDWTHAPVLARARALGEGAADEQEIARRCFEWVRDEIRHTIDHGERVLTCSASQVLAAGSGTCYAKSHLLAALLRAHGIPTGFSYQRLAGEGGGPPYTLHGLNAVQLPGFGWYRVDPRGNRAGVDARWSPPLERLAFRPALPGEWDCARPRPEPLAAVLAALSGHAGADARSLAWPDLEHAPA
jgi:transglutaminase-like putative cysteine protease